MNDKLLIKLVAILSLTVLESVNMIWFNIDSTVFGLVIAAISGLAGYELGIAKRPKK